MSVTLDTSGAVEAPSRVFPGTLAWWRWSDLSPFCQGYVEAAFAERMPGGLERWSCSSRFSDLHPDTLARFMEDCERFLSVKPDGWRQRENGAHFWELRQRGKLRAFPPLRLYFSPDGKVMAEEVSKEIAK